MLHVLVPLAQGCEELEAITITDLLVRAGIKVTTCGLDSKPVTASRGTVIVPTTRIEKVVGETFDAIILPGGLPGADHLRDNPQLQQLLKRHAAENHYIAAICAAPKVLAQAGLLAGRTATAYPGTLEEIPHDDIHISDNAVEIDGKLITSRGPGTAMDFALTLIQQLAGQDRRLEVEHQLVG